jgi:hypothetical protein
MNVPEVFVEIGVITPVLIWIAKSSCCFIPAATKPFLAVKTITSAEDRLP